MMKKMKNEEGRMKNEKNGHRRVSASFFILHSSFKNSGFTLIEVMIVVAIVGMIAAMGLPSLAGLLRKDGMRKAVSNISETCETARANAIFKAEPVAVIIDPVAGTFAAESGIAKGSAMVAQGKLPDGISIDALGINSMDFTQSKVARVFFYPDGTSDEMLMVLHGRDGWRKISLEFATGLPVVSDVDK
jgi:general secretion pathway protein H